MKTLQPLKQPRPVKIDASGSGEPVVVVLSGRRMAVERVEDIWRVDDEWWRDEVSRLYYRLLLEDGRTVTVYHDLTSRRWFNQNYD